MEKFTKEVIQASKQMFQDWFTRNDGLGNYNDYLDSLLKPEREKIVVEIETGKIFSVRDIKHALNYRFSEKEYNFKVTELPEVFSREDIHKMFDSKFSDNDYVDSFINKLLSERSSR